MKTTTSLTALLLSSVMSAQMYSSGVKTLTTGYTAKIDVTETLVTLTLVGPSTGWLGLGFNANSMNSIGEDVVIFDGTNLTDRTFAGIGELPTLDEQQDWTVLSNEVVSGVRTVIGQRARDTGDSNDHTFEMSATTLPLLWARKLANFTLNYHGSGACGATSVPFTLGLEDMKIDSFKLYPNPAKGFVNVELPANVETGTVKMYDALGRVVARKVLSKTDNSIATGELGSGSYMVVLRTEYGNATKTLIIE